MDRSKVVDIVCQDCGMRQSKRERCKQCNVRFGLYTCLRCSLFDDDTSKQQYHCDGCGICRQGGRQNYFHCDDCGCCLSTSLRAKHRCRAGVLKMECPVCLEDLFSSVQQNLRFEDCGHFIHEECMDKLTQNWSSYLCPLCLKSQKANASKAWQRIQEVIDQSPVPQSQQRQKQRVKVLCRDCCMCSTTNFHPVGIKCDLCNGYNTQLL
eukprot:TRINITY_DN8247_c0_g2_i7.p2 TRINITY_DN8247_c0_g2~~TRINITY_DN8247_c0_g2_i7.p2  ORF type:complete len:209 (-),score=8.49 TRINITY_DN8247_c0_g2_i7:335-961(-)